MILIPPRPRDQAPSEKTVQEMAEEAGLNKSDRSYLCARAAQLNHRRGGYQFEHCFRDALKIHQQQEKQRAKANRDKTLQYLLKQ